MQHHNPSLSKLASTALIEPTQAPSPSTATVNTTTLRRDLARLSQDIRELKSSLRTTWVRPMVAEQRHLLLLKARATERLCLLAACRGRAHLADPVRATKLVLRVWPTYRTQAADDVCAGKEFKHALG